MNHPKKISSARQRKPVDAVVVARERGKVTPPEAAPQKPQRTRDGPQQPRAPPVVFSIKSFCESHLISAAKFFELCREGRGPRLMKIDRRTLITNEAAAEWRAECERQTAARRQDSAAEVNANTTTI
jgi:hypothetical protein